MTTTAPDHHAGPDPDHLKMVQSVIERLARESSNVKGWTVALAAGVIAIMRIQSLPPSAVIAAIPLIIVMALLDMYYLGVERIYRQFYGHLIAPGSAERISTWSMTPGALREKRFLGALRQGIGIVPMAFYIALFVAVAALVTVASGAEDSRTSPPAPACSATTSTPSGTDTPVAR